MTFLYQYSQVPKQILKFNQNFKDKNNNLAIYLDLKLHVLLCYFQNGRIYQFEHFQMQSKICLKIQ